MSPLRWKRPPRSPNTGLKVYAQLDDRVYEKGVEVSDEQLDAVNITRNAFHGEWNYAIIPAPITS